MEKEGLKLAFDLIIGKVDNNKKIIEGSEQRIQIDTLDNIGIDYSEDIKRVHWEESSLYDDLIELMQDTIVQEKVVKALINKGLITKNNVNGIDLSLMVWDISDDGVNEFGSSWVNANPNIDLYTLVSANNTNN